MLKGDRAVDNGWLYCLNWNDYPVVEIHRMICMSSQSYDKTLYDGVA